MNALSLRHGLVRLFLFSPRPVGGRRVLLAYLVVGWALFAIALATAIASAALAITLAWYPAAGRRRRDRPLVRQRGADQASAVLRRGRLLSQSPSNRRPGGMLARSAPSGATPPPGATSPTCSGHVRAALHSRPDRPDGAAGVARGHHAARLVLVSWHTIHGVRYHGAQLGYFPNGPHGHPGDGLYIDTLPKALLAAAVCLILFVAFSYVLVATAKAHLTVARNLLGTPGDPLREAREVLGGPPSAVENAAHPGLIRNLIPNGR